MASPALLHDLIEQAAARHADAPAVTHDGTTLSYQQLHEASLRLTGWLIDGGLRRGDRVVIAARNHVLVPALLYAVSRAGGVFVATYHRVTDGALRHVLTDCEPRLLISQDPAARQMATGLGVASAGLDDVAAVCAARPACGPDGRTRPVLTVDPVCLIYTSGSVASPRAVVSTHAQAMFAVSAIQSRLCYRSSDTVYCALPLSFDYGLYQLFLAASAGAHAWLAAGLDVGPALVASLSDSQATVLPAVPSIAASLAQLLRRQPGTRLPLRMLTNTGAAMPAVTLTELRARIPGLHVHLMFGLTECKRVSIMGADEDIDRPGAVGLPLPGTEVIIADENGLPCDAGETGEIVVRGPHVMAGYWHQPDLTALRFHRAEGLFPELRTGDYGRLDEDGYLYFSGRRDDIYKQNGFRVSALEVEAAACRLPGIAAAAVLPPCSQDSAAVLFVVGKTSPADVLFLLRRELEDYKIPGACFARDELPLTSNGKTHKKALAASLPKDIHA
jgi:acyl-CoA synthetase (AMP-forming)/AMP-acid ligase II